jgi:uncharacterized protein (UPF0262 family)
MPMTGFENAAARKSHRLIAVTVDENAMRRAGPAVEHERKVAIHDLLESNTFAPLGRSRGPFKLHLGITGSRLIFDVRLADDTPVMVHLMQLAPLRRIVKDYFMVCDSYYAAIRTAPPERIEALDMGRRSLHDEGSERLMDRLKHKVKLDLETARRLFTLICVLHWSG